MAHRDFGYRTETCIGITPLVSSEFVSIRGVCAYQYFQSPLSSLARISIHGIKHYYANCENGFWRRVKLCESNQINRNKKISDAFNNVGFKRSEGFPFDGRDTCIFTGFVLLDDIYIIVIFCPL